MIGRQANEVRTEAAAEAKMQNKNKNKTQTKTKTKQRYNKDGALFPLSAMNGALYYGLIIR